MRKGKKLISALCTICTSLDVMIVDLDWKIQGLCSHDVDSA